MKWFSSKDKLPNDQQEVLVRKRGTVSLGKFDSSARKFNLRDGTALSANGDQVEWMELVAPEQGR
jgi:hypothetical protein